MYAIFKDDIFEKAKVIYRQHSEYKAGNINIKQLGTHQNNELKNIITYVVNNSPFYREHLKGLTSSYIEKLCTGYGYPGSSGCLPFGYSGYRRSGKKTCPDDDGSSTHSAYRNLGEK